MQSTSPRLAAVLREVRWRPRGAGVQLQSYSNEVWLFEDVVVRICWRGDRRRLAREAAVLRALAGRVACPEVLAASGDEELGWMLTRRLPGRPLRSVWPGLDRRARRAAVEALGHMLRLLHETAFDAATKELLASRDPIASNDPEAVVGADLNPLPAERALCLVPAVRRLPLVDTGLIDAAQALLTHLVDPLAAGFAKPVVHGDAHLDNVLWHADGIALLDFEWVRPGPADLELEAFLRFENELAPQEAALYRDVPAWLRGAYPGLFAHRDLGRRLRLYELAFCLRHLLLWPPRAPLPSLPTGHPYRRLARVVAGSSPPRRWLEPGRRDT